MRKRFSDEEGREAGTRNIGRLALGLIPAALGGAAVLWIIAASGYVDLGKSVQAERRVMANVGLVSVPVTPIKFEVHDGRCLKIPSASMVDGDHFVFYAKNECAQWLTRPNYSYRVLAHDTTIESGTYAFSDDKQIAPSERREQKILIEHGISRADTIRITAID